MPRLYEILLMNTGLYSYERRLIKVNKLNINIPLLIAFVGLQIHEPFLGCSDVSLEFT